MKQIIATTALATALLGLVTVPVRAELKLCNNTPSVVQVAIGYKDKEGWASEGWWTVKPTACSVILKGPLIARYYYVYALDEKKIAGWPGKALMCIKDKIFTIRGIDKCQERGYLQQGFFEVDSGDRADWVVSLSNEKSTPVQPAQVSAPDAPKTQP